MAYTQQAKWDEEEDYELLEGELSDVDDFEVTGDKQPIEDMVAFFKERGHEYSVYTIDWTKGEIMFVKTTEGADLRPFSSFMQAQREKAEEILMMPISQLQGVADAVVEEVKDVQEIFVYNTGRCGCTLFNNAADVLPSVRAVCQPDVYNVIAAAALACQEDLPDEDDDEEEDIYKLIRDDATAVTLVRNLTTVFNYYLFKSDPLKRSTILYTLAPDSTVVGRVMARAHPKAKTAFLYRNGLKFYESHLRLILDNEKRHYLNFQKARKLGRNAFCFEKEYGSVTIFGDDPELDNDEVERDISYYIVTLWQGTMHKALKLREQFPENFFHAVLSYETLAEKKTRALQEVMEKLGIKVDISDADIEVPLAEVFSKESLADTAFSSHPKREDNEYQPHSDEWVGDWDRGVFDKVCKSTGWEPADPDFVFPDTI